MDLQFTQKLSVFIHITFIYKVLRSTMKFKLTSKLLIPLAGMVILGLAVSIVIAYVSAKNGLEQAVTEQLVQVSTSSESKISQWLSRNEIDIDTWSKMDVVVNSLGDSDPDKSRVSASSRMKNYIDQYKIFDGMRLANDQGLVIASSHEKNINTVNVATREYFIAAMKGESFISEPLLSSTSGKPIVVIASPVRSGDSIKGVLYAVIDLGGFTNAHLDTIKVGKTGYIYMTNHKGLVLAYPPDDKAIMKLDVSGFEFGKKMSEMKNGVLAYTFEGVSKITAFNEVGKTGWIVVATAPSDEVFAEAYVIRRLLIITGVIVTAVLCLGIVFLVSVFVIKPLNQVILGLKDIAQGDGDLTKQLVINSQDELGELANWFNTFLGNMQHIIADISSNSHTVDTSSGKLLEIATTLAASAEESSNRARTVAAASEEMGANMNAIAQTMETTMQNTSMVAAAAEEMTSTINEIAKNSEDARSISAKAVAQAATASKKMTDLGVAAQSIGAVTETINDISEQTNLLALNATIEAARAGEAGKGFAVVANEIKDLARQTAAATADIKKKITGVQGTTKETAAEIGSISAIINDINDIIASIATAIEEQSAATSEIARNVNESSQGIEQVNQNIAEGVGVIGEINRDISSVNTSSDEISNGSQNVATNAEELKAMAARLNDIVGKFKF